MLRGIRYISDTLIKTNSSKNGVELGLEVGDAAVVHDVIIGGGDGAAFFEVFDFAVVAFADFLGVKGAFGALSYTLVAQGFGSDNGDKGELAREFMLKDFVLGPGIDAVQDDAFLASSDEVFGLSDSLLDDPIFTLSGADRLTKFAFAIRGDFQTALLHFFINHAAKVNFGHALSGEIVDGDGFARTAHANNGEDFDVT